MKTVNRMITVNPPISATAYSKTFQLFEALIRGRHLFQNLTVPLKNLLVPTPFTGGGGGGKSLPQ